MQFKAAWRVLDALPFQTARAGSTQAAAVPVRGSAQTNPTHWPRIRLLPSAAGGLTAQSPPRLVAKAPAKSWLE